MNPSVVMPLTVSRTLLILAPLIHNAITAAQVPDIGPKPSKGFTFARVSSAPPMTQFQ